MLGMAFCGLSHARVNTTVWHVNVSGQDSLFNEGLARDLSQAFAEDTGLKVFDARRRGSGLLDTLFRRDPNPSSQQLLDVLPNHMELAIALSCRPLETSLECRCEGRFLNGGASDIIDTAQYVFDALVKRRLFAACIARHWRERWRKISVHWDKDAKLVFKQPALPARLLRDLEILSDGPIAEMPPGTQLETFDMATPALALHDRLSYVLYRNGSYAYPLPNVVQLNKGTLGIWHRRDSTTIGNAWTQVTRLDSSNLLWQSLGNLAALDSTHFLWKALGEMTKRNNDGDLMQHLRNAAGSDSNSSLQNALRKMASVQGSERLLQSLSQVAALDTSDLVWRGLAHIASLDSNHGIWRKLNYVTGPDSGSVWRQLGLMAFQDSTLWLTPSCAIRGQPEIMLLWHEGSETRIDLVQGRIAALPLLGSQGAVRVPDLHTAITKGFALKLRRMEDAEGERLSSELTAIASPKSMRFLADFLPARLFNRNTTLPAFPMEVQNFIIHELAEIDAAPERLGFEDISAGANLHEDLPGRYETGCYLCRPDRLGP